MDGIQINGTANGELLYGTRRDDVMAGGDGNDWLFSGMGDDFVYAGTGDDHVIADLGNDTYIGGSGVDSVRFYVIDASTEYAGDSYDEGVTLSLSATTAQNLGQLGRDVFSGFENIFGSEGNDRFTGSPVSNSIIGGGGSDVINGLGGADYLNDDSGYNTVNGGTGMDDIVLGGFGDRLIYKSVADAPHSSGDIEEISYFLHVIDNKGTKINLAAIDADPSVAGNQAFDFIGQSAFAKTNPGEIRFVRSGNDCTVFVNSDNDATPEMALFIFEGGNMHAYDFIL